MILDARSSIASYNTHSIPRSLRGFGFLIKSFCVLDFKSFFEPEKQLTVEDISSEINGLEKSRKLIHHIVGKSTNDFKYAIVRILSNWLKLKYLLKCHSRGMIE